jgi:hypothetical protein
LLPVAAVVAQAEVALAAQDLAVAQEVSCLAQLEVLPLKITAS